MVKNALRILVLEQSEEGKISTKKAFEGFSLNADVSFICTKEQFIGTRLSEFHIDQ